MNAVRAELLSLPGTGFDDDCARIAEAAYQGLDGTTAVRARDSFQRMRVTSGLHRMGAFAHGELRGFIAATTNSDSPLAWQVWWLAVQTGDRRRGLGTQLIRDLEADARKAGVVQLWLWTWQTAEAAMALYDAVGWQKCERVVVELEGDARGPLQSRWVYRREIEALR